MSAFSRLRCRAQLSVLVATFVAAVTTASLHARQTTASVGSLPLDIVTRPWTGDLDGMVQRRRVRILTPYSKTHYFIDKGVSRGIVFDFGMKVEQGINRALQTTPATKVHVVFVPTRSDQLYQALIDGRGDIIGSNLVVTAARTKYVDFTVPGQTNVNEVIVTGPNSRAIENLGDLGGMEVAVREGSVELESVLALNVEFAKRGQRPVVVRALPPTLEDEDLLEMVNAGLLEASVVQDVIAEFWAKVLPDLMLHGNIPLRQGVTIAWAVRKDSPKLLDVLNPIVEANKVGTPFGNMTLQTYLRSAKFVKRATRAPDLARFRALQETFQRYARRYELDHLLMMAQAYQESGLNHPAKSTKGAIGIMQLMPATGREMKVGDIRELESNVHAGVKYIRLLIDRHFQGEAIDPFNKTLFAFAAYNCGPGRLRELRGEAQRRGLDPNLWFNNVERIAGERVGRQTVEYVSSIYKYFVAYKLAAEATS